jgi:spore germination protein GerM
MSGRVTVLLVILLAVLGAGVYYLRTLSRRILFEPPRRTEEAARARLNEVALQAHSGTTQTATLYFPSLSTGKLEPETRPITWAVTDTDRIRQVLLALIEGPSENSQRALSATTNVRAVFLTADGTAYVDLSNDVLAGLTPGIETETLAVYSMVDSVTANIPAVKRVRILIQGQEVETLDGHADLTAAYVPDPSYIGSAAP